MERMLARSALWRVATIGKVLREALGEAIDDDTPSGAGRRCSRPRR